MNPCCAQLKTSYIEKRKVLRQGITILKEQIDRLQLENLNLKQACDEGRTRENVLEEQMGKEASLRISMENKIAAMNSEISSKCVAVPENEELNKEMTLLRTCLSERQVEIDHLKRLLAEQGRRADAENDHADTERKRVAELQQELAYEKSKVDEARNKTDAMENENAALKSKISTSGPAVEFGSSGTQELNKKLTLLETCIYERELDIDRLKELLNAEERKAGAEKQRADLERKTVVELQEALAYEKCRAEEASKVANDLGKKNEEHRVQLENLKSEVDKMRLNCEEAKKKLEVEKKKVIDAKMRADEEKTRVIEQRRIAKENEKKVIEEKSHASKLLIQLEEKEQNVNKLQKEFQEAMSSQRSSFSSMLDEVKRNLEAEMKKYAREKKRADDETSKREDQKKVAEASTKRAIEEKHRADKVSQDLMSSRQRVEYLEKQLHEVNNMLEAERNNALWQEKRAEAEKLKSDEQERIAAENVRLATVEKLRANNLCHELENSSKKLQDMENELHELKSLGKLRETSDISPVVNEQTSELQFLQKQLKFEKQRVKHAKEVAELEKDRNSMLQQDLFKVRQGLECYLYQLDVLTDIGARNGVNNVSKNSVLSDMRTGRLSKTMSPSLLYPRGDVEFRMFNLSLRDASSLPKENRGLVPAGNPLESPSGMETELDVLVGGSHRETLRSSALNLDTVSFSDEQLMGSQGRVVGSLTTSAILASEKSNLEETILKRSNECHRWMDGERVGTIAENSVRSPFKTNVHATKRRKILDEFEYIKSMHSEGKRIFEEVDKKLSALHGTIDQPMIEQMEKENCVMPVCVLNSCCGRDQSSKERKASREPEVTCLHLDDSNMQADVGKHVVALTASKKLGSSVVLQDQANKKRKALHGPEATYLHTGDDSSVQAELGRPEIVLSTSYGPENSVVLRDASRDVVRSNQDDISCEEVINGDYLKLLNLDNAIDEECFRTAMESPLSPTLPEISIHDNQTRIHTQVLSVHTSNRHEARDQHGGIMHEKIQLYCILFSDMEGDSTINRIFSSIRTCLAQCSLSLDTNWLVHELLAALGLEKDLRPREKVCVLFTLILLNFSGVSSRKFEDYHNEKLLDSFRAHINSVMSGVEKRVLFEEICHISDLISLFEDFVMSRRILLQSNATFESLHDSSSSFVSPNVASIELVMAGSIILASICNATGHIGSICEVSFNIVRMWGTEDQMTLRILHIFAYLCGHEYVSNSSTSMRVVKSLIILLENNMASNPGMDLRSRSNGDSCFIPCAQCPFSEGLFSLDDVSVMLMEELQNYCVGHLGVNRVTVGQSHLSIAEPVFCNLSDVLSSLELIASKMGWKWACNKIVPKLLKMLESCDRGKVSSTALISLLGELGRLGVNEDEDEDGVEIIKRKLSDCLCHVDTSKHNAFSIAVVSALVGLHPKYDEEFVNINETFSSSTCGMMRNCLSSLSHEQITSLFGLENPLVM